MPDDLWTSGCAAQRLEAVALVADDAAEPCLSRLRALLPDDAPFVFRRAGHALIGEVRFAALDRLQTVYQRSGRRPDFGAVVVRKAMPAADAARHAGQALTRVPASAREAVLAAADAFLSARVQPPAGAWPALRAYRALQQLGLIGYREEEVDPDTYRTPLQTEILRSQMRRPRPTPHLRVFAAADPGLTLGYVYKSPADQTRWGLDFAEGGEARAAQAQVLGALRIAASRVAGHAVADVALLCACAGRLAHVGPFAGAVAGGR